MTDYQISDSPNLKEFADENFRLGENCEKFSKRLENMCTAGKEKKMLFTSNFAFFLQWLQKTCTPDT